MADYVLTLLREGHRGPIVAISRRGLMARGHRRTAPVSFTEEDGPFGPGDDGRQRQEAQERPDNRVARHRPPFLPKVAYGEGRINPGDLFRYDPVIEKPPHRGNSSGSGSDHCPRVGRHVLDIEERTAKCWAVAVGYTSQAALSGGN